MSSPISRAKPAASDTKRVAAHPRGTAAVAGAQPFWKRKTLEELTPAEWESLCDGCGRCCLVKLEDEESGEIHFTDIACKLFNPSTCRCTNYAHRHRRVRDCIKLTPDKVRTLGWLPPSCAYRLIAEGAILPGGIPSSPDRIRACMRRGYPCAGISRCQKQRSNSPTILTISWLGQVKSRVLPGQTLHSPH
jgi:uncharacterized cysteine cluster protein YcgN (CxxCxxCC family)